MPCAECQPADLPKGPRKIDRQHVAIRFGDTNKVRILLDDANVSEDCQEAMANTVTEPGLTVLFDRGNDGHIYKCECGDRVKLKITRGNVIIEMLP